MNPLEGEIDAMNLVQSLFQSFAQYEEKPAIQFAGQWIRYRQIKEEVLQRALWLQEAGVRKGDRVALNLPKGLEFIYWHLAILGVGGISLPLNPAHPAEEVAYLLTDSASSLLITDSSHYEPLREVLEEIRNLWILILDHRHSEGWHSWIHARSRIQSDGFRPVPVRLDDTALILYTSGTTGRPKGAMISHRNLIFNLKALQELWEWTDRDTLLHVLPLFHIHGLVAALHTALFSGSKVILMEKFEPQKTWQTLERERCTIFTAVPTIYFRMLKAWDACRPDLSSMRLFISGAAPLPGILFQQFAETSGFRIMERYGMTEAGIIASNPLDPSRRLAKSVGYPLPGVEVRVTSEDGEDLPAGEVGEVWVRGDNLFKGYWQNQEKTKEALRNGWFRTGDLGFAEPNEWGRIYLVGRAKELIITGGENVYPIEVENVLERHPAVHEAAVVGLPDEDFGERVTAIVTCRKGECPPTAKEIISFCKERLVGFKCPKEIHIVDQLPRNSMGKVEKMLIKKRLARAETKKATPQPSALPHGLRG